MSEEQNPRNREAPRIDISLACRQHALFPLLDFGLRSSYQHQSDVESRIRSIEKDTHAIKNALEELNTLIHDQAKASYNVKDAGYEDKLRCSTANVFCESLTRLIPDVKLIPMIKSVLKDDAKEKYKFDVALRYVKNKLSIFRTEERRRVLGISQYARFCKMATSDVLSTMMSYMKASDNKKKIYMKHLALLRRFVREKPLAAKEKKFYCAFASWLSEIYPDGNPNDNQWKDILEDDKAYDYSTAETDTADQIQEDNVGSDPENDCDAFAMDLYHVQT